MEIDISLPNKIYRGNNIEIGCHLDIELTDCIIKAEIFDRFYSSLHLSSEVATEIEIVDEEDGTFVIHVDKDSTNLFHLISYIEITLIDSDDKEITVYFAPIQFADNIYLRA
jgi:uncharacterized protein YlaN (UPF0358 family)